MEKIFKMQEIKDKNILAKILKLIFIIIIVLAFGLLYKDVIMYLFKIWSKDGNYSHGFFVPILISFMIWRKRKELSLIKLRPFWPSSLLILFSGLLLIAGQLTIHGFSRNFSLVLMIFSLTLLIFGSEWTKKLLFPLAFLIFLIPLPELFTRKITWPLQLFSSYISVNFLSMVGYPVLREGNIIELPEITLSVVEACSGLRSILALSFLAATVGYFFLNDNRKRFILIFCTFPIAIFLNWVRIITTAMIANFWGQKAALGFFHNFSGLIIFAAASVLIGLIMFFLGKKGGSNVSLTDNNTSTVKSENHLRLSAIIVCIGLLFLIKFYGSFIFSQKPDHLVDLNNIPLKIGNYIGTNTFIDSGITAFSNVTQDRSILYRNPNNSSIGVYLGYYRTNQDGKGFFHGSDVCLPGAGWRIKKKEKIIMDSLNNHGSPIEVLKYVSTKRGRTQVLITWLQAGEVIGTGSREFRVKLFWDAFINLNYNDTTKIMIQTLLAPGESEQDGTERIIQFLNYFYPEFRAMQKSQSTSFNPVLPLVKAK